MSLSRESIKRLRQVKRAILAQPKFYDQSIAPTYTDSQCGTVCCIAGWAAWVRYPKTYERRITAPDYSWRAGGAAALGIPYDVTLNLFSDAAAWPGSFGEEYYAAYTPIERARIAAERIEHFIATDGAE